MGAPEVRVHPDAALLASATAARLLTRLADVTAARGSASLVLTGGTIGIQVLAAVAAAPARDAVNWRQVDIWWGDEAFLPAGDPARVETQARAALLDHVDVSQDRVHPMPSADDPGTGGPGTRSPGARGPGAGGPGARGPGARSPGVGDPQAAADRYAAELRSVARSAGAGDVPAFDVLLLGIGPDAHVASLFPGLPGASEEGRAVVGVTGAPKPPPTRISLTLPAITAAREVWVVAAGADQAEAVRLALSAADPSLVPAAGARGRERTLFLLDQDAAAKTQTAP
jgi:6-phosphogluconolactonase